MARVRQWFATTNLGPGATHVPIGVLPTIHLLTWDLIQWTKESLQKGQTKIEESQGNLAQIVTTNNSNELTLGAWCGFTTDSTNTREIPDTDLGIWITAISRSSKKKNTTAICKNCNSIFYRPKRATNPTCSLCNSAFYSALMRALTGDPDAYVAGHYYTNPKTGRVIYAPTTSIIE